MAIPGVLRCARTRAYAPAPARALGRTGLPVMFAAPWWRQPVRTAPARSRLSRPSAPPASSRTAPRRVVLASARLRASKRPAFMVISSGEGSAGERAPCHHHTPGTVQVNHVGVTRRTPCLGLCRMRGIRVPCPDPRHARANQRRQAIRCRYADCWTSMPNVLPASRGQGRVLLESGPVPALWRSACWGRAVWGHTPSPTSWRHKTPLSGERQAAVFRRGCVPRAPDERSTHQTRA
jgi:hypothetical protein